ncbi:type II toxin-antitoxin system RelE/ParE family toxin [Candidatus Aerophobetes bacterium]|nr:type II toxin-antitoxin system RelE/ParE family toxin [Candidatus Aerophobetes bacterium]
MKYRIIWDKKPARQIKKFDSQIRRIVKEKVDKLIENPHQYAFLSGPLSSLRKIDISTPSGQYRVAFSIDEKEQIVGIIFVGPRENFYKELQRYLG